MLLDSKEPAAQLFTSAVDQAFDQALFKLGWGRRCHGLPVAEPTARGSRPRIAVGILGPYLFGCGLKTFAMLSLFIFQQLWSIMMGLIADFTTK